MSSRYACRICTENLVDVFIDLGSAPPSNAYLSDPDAPETWLPLRVYSCGNCGLVQLPDHASAEDVFGGEYLYFSSYSASWVEHARQFAVRVVERFKPDLVIELASNDGYCLRHFQQLGVDVLGVEPAPNVARVAIDRGVPTLRRFFGREVAEQLVRDGVRPDVVYGANVLAHVPDLHDFVGGAAELVTDDGVVIFEFPHLLRLVEDCQFDTIYHEHYSYFSLHAVRRVLREHGLFLYDVEHLTTHGGSVRVYASKGTRIVSDALSRSLDAEADARLTASDTREAFQRRARGAADDLLRFLLDAGGRVAAYGAAAKGNTLLNYARVRGDLVRFAVDDNPHKQGRYLPGSRIPVVPPGILEASANELDYVLVMPWNLHAEIAKKFEHLDVEAVSPVDVGSW